MALDITGAFVGYDQQNVRGIIKNIQDNFIKEVSTAVNNNVDNVLNEIDNFWVGAAADAFKDKMLTDTEIFTKALAQLSEGLGQEITQMMYNLNNSDGKIAEDILAAAGLSSAAVSTGYTAGATGAYTSPYNNPYEEPGSGDKYANYGNTHGPQNPHEEPGSAAWYGNAPKTDGPQNPYEEPGSAANYGTTPSTDPVRDQNQEQEAKAKAEAEERARLEEEARKTEEEMARREETKAMQEEASKQAEEQRLAEEQAAKEEEERKAAEEQAAKEEAERKAAEEEAARKAEEERLAKEEEERKAEEERLAKEEEERKAEEERLAKEEEERKAEEERLAKEEEERKAEEERLAQEEAERKAEEERIAEEQRLAEEQAAEEARIAEEQRLAEEQAQQQSDVIPTLNSDTTFIDSTIVDKVDNMTEPGFSKKLEEVAEAVNCSPTDLLTVMYSESHLDASARNPGGSASGLFQLTSVAAQDIGVDINEFRKMSPNQQLDVAKLYFQKCSDKLGASPTNKMKAEDLYAYNFLPARAHKEILAVKNDPEHPEYYNSNKDLDIDHDGVITKTDLRKVLEGKYSELYNS